MINIQRKEDCCGCGACVDACVKKAIVWKPDYEGFSYPHVNTSKCVNCGLCNKVCPIENSDAINALNATFEPVVFAAYHKDENIRLTSTSGGAFWGLAESWVKNGGYVAGAVWVDHFKVKHIVTNSIEELQRIKGSKYVQSDARGMYKEIARLLKAGEKVLATGLPCQMAALRQFLYKNYENLLVVDLICHSVTSPLPFDKYISYLETKYGSEVLTFHPKNKESGGWHKFAFKATFANGETYLRHAADDYYCIISYRSSILCRYSCFECHYKHFPQPSDITIGDFWGIEKIDHTWDSPKGVSKIMLNTPKGSKYFKTLDVFDTKVYDAEMAIFQNPRSWPMIRSLPRCDMQKREAFVNDLHEHDLDYCMKKHILLKTGLKHKIKKLIKKYVGYKYYW